MGRAPSNVVPLPVKRKWCVLMFRFSVARDGIERYQDTKRCGYETVFLGLVG